MRLVERRPDDLGVVTQLLAGFSGVFITTIPAFLFIPFWILFVKNYRIVDDNGDDDDVTCFFIGLLSGISVWLFVILIGVIL